MEAGADWDRICVGRVDRNGRRRGGRVLLKEVDGCWAVSGDTLILVNGE